MYAHPLDICEINHAESDQQFFRTLEDTCQGCHIGSFFAAAMTV